MPAAAAMPARIAAKLASSASAERFHVSRSTAVSTSSRDARERSRHAQRDHVGPASRDALGRLLERHREVAGAACAKHVRRVAAVAVADDHARRGERYLVGEAMDVLPVDREQQVEPVVEAVRGRLAEAHQRRRLAAAYLRAARAHHETVEARLRRGVEQQRSRRHHAAAAAAGERDGDARRGARAPCLLLALRMHLSILLRASGAGRAPRFRCPMERSRSGRRPVAIDADQSGPNTAAAS